MSGKGNGLTQLFPALSEKTKSDDSSVFTQVTKWGILGQKYIINVCYVILFAISDGNSLFNGKGPVDVMYCMYE